MKIDLYISELLFNHDCVIVPELGGFVGNRQPARVDAVQNKLSPPYKAISFNQRLVNGDGLLASFIAEKKQLSYPEAVSIISKDVQQRKTLLDQGERVPFEKVGTLYTDKHGNVRFEQDYSVNYLTEAFGLSSFHALPVEKHTEAPVAQSERTIEKRPLKRIAKKDHKPEFKEKQKRRGAVKAVSLALAVLPLLIYIAWLSFSTPIFKKGKFHYSDLNPFTEKICELYKERHVPDPIKENPAGAGEEMVPLIDSVNFMEVSFVEDPALSDKKITVRLREEAMKTVEAPSEKHKAAFKFHVIGGCFRYYKNAEGLVQKLRNKGYHASIVDRNKGLYRVSFNSFTGRNEAVEFLSGVKKKENTSAWLLVK